MWTLTSVTFCFIISTTIGVKKWMMLFERGKEDWKPYSWLSWIGLLTLSWHCGQYEFEDFSNDEYRTIGREVEIIPWQEDILLHGFLLYSCLDDWYWSVWKDHFADFIGNTIIKVHCNVVHKLEGSHESTLGWNCLLGSNHPLLSSVCCPQLGHSRGWNQQCPGCICCACHQVEGCHWHHQFIRC